MDKYDCVIFDFDGTLADTNTGIVKTYQATFRHMGLPEHTPEEISPTIGLPLKEIIGGLNPGLTDEQIEYGSQYYRKIFNDVALSFIKIFPGVKETLTSLKEKGVKLAVASSRGADSLFFLIDYIGLGGMFDIICHETSVPNPKPAPDLVLLIQKELGVAPERTLVVGDTTYDLLMGIAAGSDTLGVTCGNHSAEKLQSVNPTYIAESVAEIEHLSLCSEH